MIAASPTFGVPQHQKGEVSYRLSGPLFNQHVGPPTFVCGTFCRNLHHEESAKSEPGNLGEPIGILRPPGQQSWWEKALAGIDLALIGVVIWEFGKVNFDVFDQVLTLPPAFCPAYRHSWVRWSW